jgi:protein TonB
MLRLPLAVTLVFLVLTSSVSFAQIQSSDTMGSQPPVNLSLTSSPPTSSSPSSENKPQDCSIQRYYPPISARLGEEGTVILGFTISAQGEVIDPVIVTSSGHDRLDAAALQVAKCWHYRPAMQNGQPISVPWKALVKWSLTDG